MLTVVVQAADARGALARTLPSLFEQDEAPERVLVLDRASTDGTADWLRLRWPAVEHRRLPPDTAASSLLDRLLAASDGGSLLVAQAGDEWRPGAFARLRQALERHPLVVMASGCGERPAVSLDALRGADAGKVCLAAEVRARVRAAPVMLMGQTQLPAVAPPPPAASVLDWPGMLGAGFGDAAPIRLIGLAAAERPMGLLDLLGRAVALHASGCQVAASTLADLRWEVLEGEGTLVLALHRRLRATDAALLLVAEEVLRRVGERRVVLAMAGLGDEAGEVGERLSALALAHPTLELHLADRVSTAYAAGFVTGRVRLLPPGLGGLAGIFAALRQRFAALVPTLAEAPDWTLMLNGEAAWRAVGEPIGADRLAPVMAGLFGLAPLLREPALERAWRLVLPGWAGIAAPETCLATDRMDVALMAGLGGRPVRLAQTAPGCAAFVDTWEAALTAAGIGTGPCQAAT